MAPEKTIVGVTTIGGNDAFVYSDGSMSSLEEIDGVNEKYFILVPVDIEVALKTEDAGNTNYSSLPGYIAPGNDTGVVA